MRQSPRRVNYANFPCKTKRLSLHPLALLRVSMHGIDSAWWVGHLVALSPLRESYDTPTRQHDDRATGGEPTNTADFKEQRCICVWKFQVGIAHIFTVVKCRCTVEWNVSWNYTCLPIHFSPAKAWKKAFLETFPRDAAVWIRPSSRCITAVTQRAVGTQFGEVDRSTEQSSAEDVTAARICQSPSNTN